jgi:peptidoglycan/LPS O-acetylase OafA/YrhL
MSVYPLAELLGGPSGAGLPPTVAAPCSGWRAVLFYLGTGSHSFAYWYIPFIMAMFLLSPLFILFIEMKGGRQWQTFLALLLIAMIIHRPVDNFYLPQSVLYFTPLYLLGILASLRKETIYARFRGRAVPAALLGAAAAMAMLQGSLHFWFGNFHKEMLQLTTLDINLPQKVLLCLFFMVFLARYEGRPVRALDLLARVSFAVFFIHPLVIRLALRFELRPAVPGPLGWLLFTALVLGASIGLALLVKRLIPRHSRYVIGY